MEVLAKSQPAPRSEGVGSAYRIQCERVVVAPTRPRAGAELSFGRFQLNGFQLADVVLIDNNDHTCSTTPPSTGVGHMQLGYMLIPAGKATSRG